MTAPSAPAFEVSRPRLSATAFFLAVALAGLSYFGLVMGKLTEVERIVLPTIAVVYAVMGTVVLVLPDQRMRMPRQVFRSLAGIILLVGIVDGLWNASPNLPFYLAWLPAYYASIFLVLDKQWAVRWAYGYGVVILILGIVGSLFGPLPWDHFNVILVLGSLAGQVALIILFQMVAGFRDNYIAASAREQALIEAQSELRRVADEAIRARHEAELANRSKSSFLAAMSHELRTPLNAIIGFSSVMLDRTFGDLHPKYEEYARDINESGAQLRNVIEDVLEASRIELGRLELRPESVDPEQTLAACLRLVRPVAKDRGVALSFEAADSLRPITADETKFKQIFLNLLSNAIKFNKSNGWVRMAARSLDDGALEVVVADGGLGMDPTRINEAKEAFRQIEMGLNRRHEGVGLGLFITQSLVDLHGGTFDITSCPDEGTTVTVRLPARSTAVEQTTADRAAQ